MDKILTAADICCGAGPKIMGIVNVTPDSFSDGGKWHGTKKAVAHGLALLAEGADILDIGGESTRPGADAVSVQEELDRTIPVIEKLAAETDALISIDTRKAEVMRAAIYAGAHIINDVTALEYEADSLQVAASCKCPVILMHGKGDPKTMQDNPQYGDVLQEVYDYLGARIEACLEAGIGKEQLVVDPGIGFGKNLQHNLVLLANQDKFHELGVPVLLGASRKRFIAALSGEQDAMKRIPGSVAAALQGAAQGVEIIRVHDVAETRQALKVWQAIQNERG